MKRKAFETRDFPAWIRLSGEFHTELAGLTGNAVLCDCLNGLVARSTLISALYESLGHSPCSFEDHEAILAALDAGDAKEAAALMSRHLQSVELKMLERPHVARPICMKCSAPLGGASKEAARPKSAPG